MTTRPKLPNALSNRLSDTELHALLAEADAQIAALEPVEATLDWNVLSTPELDALSAADSPEAVARIEDRIKARIAARQEQLRQPPQRKVKVTQ
jgi:hypothetical protein